MRDTENRNSVKCKNDKIRKMTEVKTTKIRKKLKKNKNGEQVRIVGPNSRGWYLRYADQKPGISLFPAGNVENIDHLSV